MKEKGNWMFKKNALFEALQPAIERYNAFLSILN